MSTNRYRRGARRRTESTDMAMAWTGSRGTMDARQARRRVVRDGVDQRTHRDASSITPPGCRPVSRRAPCGRQHRGGEMAAGRMAVHHHALAGALPEEQQRVPHLLDDVVDRDLRAEIVAGDRDRSAALGVVGQGAAGQPGRAGQPIGDASISPSAAAGAPRVAVSRLGSRAVGISWPTSARKLAVPMPTTPGPSQPWLGSAVLVMVAEPSRSRCGERLARVDYGRRPALGP